MKTRYISDPWSTQSREKESREKVQVQFLSTENHYKVSSEYLISYKLLSKMFSFISISHVKWKSWFPNNPINRAFIIVKFFKSFLITCPNCSSTHPIIVLLYNQHRLAHRQIEVNKQVRSWCCTKFTTRKSYQLWKLLL